MTNTCCNLLLRMVAPAQSLAAVMITRNCLLSSRSQPNRHLEMIWLAAMPSADCSAAAPRATPTPSVRTTCDAREVGWPLGGAALGSWLLVRSLACRALRL